MMMPPPWERMSKWQLKLMDMLTPAAEVQVRVDTLLLRNSGELRIQIKDNAVFILRTNKFRIPPVQPERFPLSKVRKDQLDRLYEIMQKQQP